MPSQYQYSMCTKDYFPQVMGKKSRIKETFWVIYRRVDCGICTPWEGRTRKADKYLMFNYNGDLIRRTGALNGGSGHALGPQLGWKTCNRHRKPIQSQLVCEKGSMSSITKQRTTITGAPNNGRIIIICDYVPLMDSYFLWVYWCYRWGTLSHEDKAAILLFKRNFCSERFAWFLHWHIFAAQKMCESNCS